MEDPVPVLLSHLGVDVEAGVPKLSDLLSQQLHSLDRVAEDDALVDLELGEESVEAVDLLLLLHVGVKLCDAAKSELIHQIDGVGVIQVLPLRQGRRKCRGEEGEKGGGSVEERDVV